MPVPKKGSGWSRFQIDFLLGGGTQVINRQTRSNWMADPRFVEMLELVRAGKSKTTDDMLDKAIGIVNEALDGKLGEDDSMRLSTAMKLIARFPDPTEPVITFRRWGGYDMKSLPDDRRQRIFEEIEDDKSLKSAALPISHVGHTKLGISKKKKKIEGETDDRKD